MKHHVPLTVLNFYMAALYNHVFCFIVFYLIYRAFTQHVLLGEYCFKLYLSLYTE